MGTDIFQVHGRMYLVTCDYHSNFIEVDFLTDLTAATVVTKLKLHFACYGITDTVVSDSGSQYTYQTFKQFAMSSPGNHQANGEAEAAVKIIK